MARGPRKSANEKLEEQIKKLEESILNEQIKVEEKTKKYIEPHTKKIEELTAKIEELKKNAAIAILTQSGLSYEELKQKLGVNEAAATAEDTDTNAEQ